MAKDGSRRGGARAGAGRKPKALKDKIAEGKSANVMVLPTELKEYDVPPVKDFMTELQRDGTVLSAKEVYEETYTWLKERGCDRTVNPQLVQQYSMSVARWIHCEQTITRFGYIAKHPTTGAAIASPYVAMAQNYMKQTNTLWGQIYQIVKENCSAEWEGTPQDSVMERLLRSRSGG